MMHFEKCIKLLNSIFFHIHNTKKNTEFTKEFRNFVRTFGSLLTERTPDPKMQPKVLDAFFKLIQGKCEKHYLYTTDPKKLAAQNLIPFIGTKDDPNSPLFNKNKVMGLQVISPFIVTAKSHTYNTLSYRVDYDPNMGLHVNVTLFNTNFHIPLVVCGTGRFSIFSKTETAAEETKFKFWLKMTLAFCHKLPNREETDLISFLVESKNSSHLKDHVASELAEYDLTPPEDLFESDAKFLDYLHTHTEVRHAVINSSAKLLTAYRIEGSQPIMGGNSEVSSEPSASSPRSKKRSSTR